MGVVGKQNALRLLFRSLDRSCFVLQCFFAHFFERCRQRLWEKYSHPVYFKGIFNESHPPSGRVGQRPGRGELIYTIASRLLPSPRSTLQVEVVEPGIALESDGQNPWREARGMKKSK